MRQGAPLVSTNSDSLDDKFSYIRGAVIPERILNFDVTQKDPETGHCMNVEYYLKNRLNSSAIELIKRDPAKAEYFLGSSEELKKFYESQTPPLKLSGIISSPTSTKFYLFEDPLNRFNYKIVITNIGSESRLNHQTLQLKFAGVDVSPIKVRGNFQDLYKQSFSSLQASLEKHAGKKIICIMGLRWFPMEFLAQKIYPNLTTTAEGTAYNKLAPTTHELGAISFDSASINTAEGDVVILAIRMPNGSLAKDVTTSLIDAGVSSFIMIGAGGSLTKSQDSGVGDYQMISSSSYADEIISLPNEVVIKPDFSGTALEGKLFVGGVNITVDSPLEETSDWLTAAKKSSTSVDVETFHIFKAINEGSKKIATGIKVIPGLFNSDVVGEHPLEEKIDMANAYVHLNAFLDRSYASLGISFKKQEVPD